MNTILQDILGLFTRKKIITGKQLKDNDYLAVAEIKGRNIGVPSERDVKLIKVSEIVPAPTQKTYDTNIAEIPNIVLNLNDSDYFVIDMTLVLAQYSSNSPYNQDIAVTLLPNLEGSFIGTKQIIIVNTSKWSGTWNWVNVKWPNGIDPVWSSNQNIKYDVITITGHAKYSNSYLGAASVNH
tara:strand:+ start:35 stop:580 length:546 start_codon:yes stop_codon:yes gene_type:complete